MCFRNSRRHYKSYTDEYIYFFHQNTTHYKFTEFTRKVAEARTFNWKMFNLPCPDTRELDQLKFDLVKVIRLNLSYGTYLNIVTFLVKIGNE